MSLLRSLFNFRSQKKGGEDSEKPFLDHLEDLRVTLMKMGTALVISMIVAFCFRNHLTQLLERPLNGVALQPKAEVHPTERERLAKEYAVLSVIAAEKVNKVSSSMEERRALADKVLQEYQSSATAAEDDPTRILLQGPKALTPHQKLIILDVTESFGIAMKLAFYAGIAGSFPFLLYFVINFILPALTRKEKRLLGPGIAGGTILFAFGIFIGFQYILPKTLVWFHAFGDDMGFETTWKAGTYFGFVTQLCLACGLLCELPLVMVVLSVLNVLSFGLLQKTRRYAVAIILVIVAIISPTPDPMTFITLAIPMLAIFEGSIWLVWLIERNRKKKELTGDEPED
jgi:sec-independent protein translocase protein TatC